MNSPEEKKPDSDSKSAATPKSTGKGKGKGRGKKAQAKAEEDALPTFGDAKPEGPAEDLSSVPPGPESDSPLKAGKTKGSDEAGATAELASMPEPFTPSINKTLSKLKKGPKPALPSGLTVATLKSRLDPKKKIK